MIELTLLARQHELPDKRRMVPRHLLLICCPDDIGAHSPQHDADVHAGVRDVRRSSRNQSGLAPENLTTLPHFSVSSAMSFLKSAGEPASTAPARSASRAFILGSARPALISWLSFSITSAGVFL